MPVLYLFIFLSVCIQCVNIFGLSCGVRAARCQQVENWWGAEREIHSFIYFSLSFSCTRDPSCLLSVFLTFLHTHTHTRAYISLVHTRSGLPRGQRVPKGCCVNSNHCAGGRLQSSVSTVSTAALLVDSPVVRSTDWYMHWQLSLCFVSSLCPLHVHVGIGWHFGF